VRRILIAMAAIPLVLLASAGTAQGAARGQGTMLVYDNTTCEGTGNASVVTLPFSLLFTGFEPGASGTVTAYTQPGGELVGSASFSLDEDGERCARVDGDAPSGQYKIVYDFGSGTGKQKVIRVNNPGGGETPEPSETTTTITSTTTVTTTATETDTVTATATITDEVTSPPATTTTTSTSTVTSTSTATATVTETTTVTTTPSLTPGPTGTDEEGGLVIRPVDPLAPSGAASDGLVPAALVLIGIGAAAVALMRRSAYAHRH